MAYYISFQSNFLHNPYQGTFIALEGIDGSGKTSQSLLLKKYLEEQGKKVTIVQFPRREQGILADITNQLIKGTSAIPQNAYQYLFSADYALLTEEIINPALQRGEVVLADRFHCWSSLAYGIWENGKEYTRASAQSLLVANGLFSIHHQFYIPDLTIFLSVSVETAMKRISHKKVKDMYEKKEVLEKIVHGYQWLLQEFPEEFVNISAEVSVQEVRAKILDAIKQKTKSE